MEREDTLGIGRGQWDQVYRVLVKGVNSPLYLMKLDADVVDRRAANHVDDYMVITRLTSVRSRYAKHEGILSRKSM